MNPVKMTSLQRVLTTIGHKEPDRVPFFLLTTMHGAKELGMTIKEYFSASKNVVDGQLKLRAKYRHDCIYNFYYAPLEIEAFGAEVIYSDNGPPNSGNPLIKQFKDIKNLKMPDFHTNQILKKVLDSTQMLKEKVGDEAPIIGVVMSPFSLPVMQMGFEKYIQLMYEHEDLFEHLMRFNMEFCVKWANAQLKAGATAICYFDPVSSTTITTKQMYEKTGFNIAKQTISQINGPTATHMASGRCLPIIDHISETGTAIIGVSGIEDLTRLKKACLNKLTVLGNLNGVEMCRWSAVEAEQIVKNTILQAGDGGGFILSDNHGEIPWQVSDDVLMAVSEAVHNWGRYPLNWTK